MSTIRFMVLGDTHGNLPAAKLAVDAAVDHNAEIIIQVGDFGFIWPGHESMCELGELDAYLGLHNRRLIFVDGNHEDHDAIEAYDKVNPRSTPGHVYIRPNILHAPRGLGWTWNRRRFQAVGGAVSIDKAWRVASQRNGQSKSWWENEVLSPEQAEVIITDAKARRDLGKRGTDYLFTHDCSDRTPWKDRMKPDLASQAHRRQLDEVLRAIRPRFHFHGHMHQVYDWMNPVAGSGMFGDENTFWTQTYGLACDDQSNNWGIFDTDLDSEGLKAFQFEKEFGVKKALYYDEI